MCCRCWPSTTPTPASTSAPQPRSPRSCWSCSWCSPRRISASQGSPVIRSRRQTQRMYDVLAYVVLAGAFAFAVFPILWTLLTSLKPDADIVTAQIQYIPLRPTFQNYVTLWGQAGFPTMFFNSTIVTALTVLV